MHSQNRNISLRSKRGVAQPGSAPGLGPGGRRFESCRPDKKRHIVMCLFFLFYCYPVNFFIYGFREAGPLYETHCKPPCGAAMRGQGHEEQFPKRRLMLFHVIRMRKPRFAERTPVHTRSTAAPQGGLQWASYRSRTFGTHRAHQLPSRQNLYRLKPKKPWKTEFPRLRWRCVRDSNS